MSGFLRDSVCICLKYLNLKYTTSELLNVSVTYASLHDNTGPGHAKQQQLQQH